MNRLHALCFVLTFALTGAVHAGYFYDGVCYSVISEANDRYFSKQPLVLTPGATSYGFEWRRHNAGYWELRKLTQSSAGVWTEGAPLPFGNRQFPACDPLEKFNDAITLGWFVAACFLLGFSVKHIRSQL